MTYVLIIVVSFEKTHNIWKIVNFVYEKSGEGDYD